MRKLNRYGLLILLLGLAFAVLMLAQGCRQGRGPGPDLEATHVTTVRGVVPTSAGRGRCRPPRGNPEPEEPQDGSWYCVNCRRNIAPGSPAKCPH